MLLHVALAHVRVRLRRQLAREARHVAELRVGIGECAEFVAVQQFGRAARALQQQHLGAALGHGLFELAQHRAVRGDAGAGADQQVAAIAVARLQMHAPERAGGLQRVARPQILEQRGGRAARHEAHRELHPRVGRHRRVEDRRQRIAALERRAVGGLEMDLDELAGQERQRLPVGTDEGVVGDGGGQVATRNQRQGERSRQGTERCVAEACSAGLL